MVRIIVSLIDTNKKLFVAMLSKRFGRKHIIHATDKLSVDFILGERRKR